MSRALEVSVCATLIALGASGCSSCSKEKPDPDFSCVLLQRRAQQCRAETLAVVKREIDGHKSDSGNDDTEQQYKMFASRFEQKLDAEQTRKQCEKFTHAKEPSYAGRVEQMKTCYATSDCDAFARCMLEM